jgi:ABC-type glycerol-3-phosphate transport system substrate-binding protein
MKHLTLIILIALTAAACTSNTAKTDTTITDTTISTTSAKSKTVLVSTCFVRTEGKNNLDSTNIQLVIKGNTVTGEMNWLPFEKDMRKGILNGTKKGDTIIAVWTFKQEGTTDTMKLNFKLDSNQLAQKPLKVNAKTGRQETDESAGYTLKYRPFIGQRP